MSLARQARELGCTRVVAGDYVFEWSGPPIVEPKKTAEEALREAAAEAAAKKKRDAEIEAWGAS